MDDGRIAIGDLLTRPIFSNVRTQTRRLFEDAEPLAEVSNNAKDFHLRRKKLSNSDGIRYRGNFAKSHLLEPQMFPNFV